MREQTLGEKGHNMLPLHHCSSVHCCPLGFVMFIFKLGLEEKKFPVDLGTRAVLSGIFPLLSYAWFLSPS